MLRPVDVPPQREYRLGPAAMAQPAALVRLRARNPEQVAHRAFHPQRGGNKGAKTRIGRIRNVFHLVFKHQHVFRKKIGGVDAEAAVTVAIIRAPESEKPAAGRAQLFGARAATRGPTFT